MCPRVLCIYLFIFDGGFFFLSNHSVYFYCARCQLSWTPGKVSEDFPGLRPENNDNTSQPSNNLTACVEEMWLHIRGSAETLEAGEREFNRTFVVAHVYAEWLIQRRGNALTSSANALNGEISLHRVNEEKMSKVANLHSLKWGRSKSLWWQLDLLQSRLWNAALINNEHSAIRVIYTAISPSHPQQRYIQIDLKLR